jgi:hypothetical protein
MEGRFIARRRAGDKNINLQQFVAHVFIQATDAVTAVALL